MRILDEAQGPATYNLFLQERVVGQVYIERGGSSRGISAPQISKLRLTYLGYNHGLKCILLDAPSYIRLEKKMSHVFISYKREDSEKRDQLIDLFKRHKLDCWWNHKMDGGIFWKPEIDRALDEAFAIVVIVTEDSMKSHYVTYEWSWAIGNHKPVVPLHFEGIPNNIHDRLKDINILNYENDKDRFIKTLQKYRRESPLIRHTESRIIRLLGPLRVLARTSLWFYQYAKAEMIDYYKEFVPWLEKASAEAGKVYTEKLPDFWLSYSHAFTPKLKERYEQLFEPINDLRNLLADLEYATQFHHLDVGKVSLDKVEQYRQKMEKSLMSFAGYNNGYFRELNAALDAISEGELGPMSGKGGSTTTWSPIQMALKWALGEEDGKNLVSTINKVAQHLSDQN